MTEILASLEAHILKLGIFFIFVVTFGDYVLKKTVPIIRYWRSKPPPSSEADPSVEAS